MLIACASAQSASPAKAGTGDQKVTPDCHKPKPPKPPVITKFKHRNSRKDLWTLSGHVTNGAGGTVSFGGVLSGYGLSGTIDGEGNFTVSAPLPGLQSGFGTVQATGTDGLESPIASGYFTPQFTKNVATNGKQANSNAVAAKAKAGKARAR
jgi:hypothetical protein